jgi:hypothetical protein
VPAWSLAAARRDELREDGVWVAGLAFPILVSHQSKEWVWPGGFLLFCNTRLLGTERADWPLTERDSFHVNITGGWLSAVTGLALWRRTPLVAAGVLMMEAGNVVFHAGMAVRERRYNPGVVTAPVLMVPHAAAGLAGWRAPGVYRDGEGSSRAPSEAPLPAYRWRRRYECAARRSCRLTLTAAPLHSRDRSTQPGKERPTCFQLKSDPRSTPISCAGRVPASTCTHVAPGAARGTGDHAPQGWRGGSP